MKNKGNIYKYITETPSSTWANKIKRLEEKQGNKIKIKKVEFPTYRRYQLFKKI